MFGVIVYGFWQLLFSSQSRLFCRVIKNIFLTFAAPYKSTRTATLGEVSDACVERTLVKDRVE